CRTLACACRRAYLRRHDRPRRARVRHERTYASHHLRRARRPLRRDRCRIGAARSQGRRVGSVPLRRRGRPLLVTSAVFVCAATLNGAADTAGRQLSPSLLATPAPRSRRAPPSGRAGGDAPPKRCPPPPPSL